MITLGQASNYRVGRVFRHLFACGNRHDSEILREKLAGHYGVQSENIALYHTGRSALAAAIKAAAGNQSEHVIVPGLTCIAVVRAVKAAGCEPIYVDIRPETLEYDYQKLENELSRFDHSIILVQNTLGITWDINKIEKLAAKYHARIIEDLAHCAGRFYADGREVGSVGVASALSFGKGKAIDTIEGGAVVFRDDKKAEQPTGLPKLSDRLRDRWYPLFGLISRWNGRLGRYFLGGLVKIHFIQRSADAELNLNHRLTHWQARLASEQLDNLPKTKLRDFRLVKDRERVLTKLRQNGYCFDEIWYDTPVSPRRYAKEADFPSTHCPTAVKLSTEIVNIPTWYPEAKLTQAYEIIKEYEINHE